MRNIAGAIDFFYPHIGSVSFPKFMKSQAKPLLLYERRVYSAVGCWSVVCAVGCLKRLCRL